MHNKKAQIAYEFLLLFFFLTAFFTMGIILVGAAKERIVDETIALHMDDFGRSLQEDFYTAAQMPEGFTRNITLPISINNLAYTTSITAHGGANYIEIKVQESHMTYRLPTITINEQLRPPPGINTLVKQGANIILN